jgi:hypothetical protein
VYNNGEIIFKEPHTGEMSFYRDWVHLGIG